MYVYTSVHTHTHTHSVYQYVSQSVPVEPVEVKGQLCEVNSLFDRILGIKFRFPVYPVFYQLRYFTDSGFILQK